MADRSFLATDGDVHRLLAGETAIYAPIRMGTSYLNGQRARAAMWSGLDFSSAWIDRGPSPAGNPGPYLKVPLPAPDPLDRTVHRVYPKWSPGGRLIVREAWSILSEEWGCDCPPFALPGDTGLYRHLCKHQRIEYRADTGNRFPGNWPDDLANDAECPKWRSSASMPAWASRITAEVKAVGPVNFPRIDVAAHWQWRIDLLREAKA